MVWGNGVRAGMYPLSEDEAYWFTCFNAGANVSSTHSLCKFYLPKRVAHAHLPLQMANNQS